MKAFGHNTTVEANGDTVKKVTYFWRFEGMKIHAYCVNNTPSDTSLPCYGSVSVHVEHELVVILELNNIDNPEYVRGIVEKWMKNHY
jgi:hypothetical protein